MVYGRYLPGMRCQEIGESFQSLLLKATYAIVHTSHTELDVDIFNITSIPPIVQCWGISESLRTL